jgi:hypothetical protein
LMSSVFPPLVSYSSGAVYIEIVIMMRWFTRVRERERVSCKHLISREILISKDIRDKWSVKQEKTQVKKRAA